MKNKTYFYFVFLFFLFGCQGQQEALFKIKGDDVGYFVLKDFINQFNEKEKDFKLSFAGGGSQTAINALLDGTVDIVFSVKELNNEDLTLLKTKKIYPAIIPIVQLPFIVIAHQTLPFDALDLNQIKNIYTGQLKYWWQLQPKKDVIKNRGLGSIDLCTVDARNGEHYFMRRKLRTRNFSYDIRSFFHSMALIDYIAENPTSIGYIALPFYSKADNIKVVYNNPEFLATGYLIFNRDLEANSSIQNFLSELQSYLYKNQFPLLQKGIRILNQNE